MSETNDQPADAGVGGQGNDAPNDDISTEAFDRMEAPDDEDDAAAGETGDGETSETGKAPPADDDSEEIELSDGRKVKVPKEVALERMRQRDYTLKTQEVAEIRRNLEAERNTWQEEREASRVALPKEHETVAILNHNVAQVQTQLAEFENIDWATFRTKALTEGGEARELYDDYRARFNATRDALTDLNDELGRAKTDLQTKEGQRLQSQREAAQAGLAKAQEETGRALAREIEGWSPELATNVAKFAVEKAGVKLAEVAEMTDPRIWKVLHTAMTALDKNAKLEAALKQHTTAAQNKSAQESRPAERPRGSGGANTRDPATPRGDGLSTEEWMRRRNENKAAKRA